MLNFMLNFIIMIIKQNLRDLILDSDHSRAATLGIQKIFKINNDNYLFNWEWTQMEQNASRFLRNAGSWYEHTLFLMVIQIKVKFLEVPLAQDQIHIIFH